MCNAYAGKSYILGSGVINGSTQLTATISFDPLIYTAFLYDITCTINDPNGKGMVLQFSVQLPEFYPFKYRYDNSELKSERSNQFTINDNNNHVISFRLMDENIRRGNNIEFTWISGIDKAIPVTYSCLVESK